MRLRAPFVAGLLVLALGAPSVQAAPRSWYAYYLDARDKHIPAKRWKNALEELEQAVKLKPDSVLNEQTYGLNFEDYLPYFYEGKCHFALGDFNSAMRMFNIEEKAGKIQQRAELWKELRRLRAEADANQRGVDTAEKVRTLTQEVAKLRLRATELHKAGNYDEALKLLAQAEGTAKVLDAGTQGEIATATQRIRDEKTRVEEATRRTQRIEKAMADGLKLLQEGNPPEAKLKFEAVLAQDPSHEGALEGRRRAEAEILASTTKENREALLQQGRSLFEAGRYEDAQRPLAEAAADPSATEAQALLARARSYVEGIQKQKEIRSRADQLLSEAEKLIEKRLFPDAYVRLGSALELEPENVRARDRLLSVGRLIGEETLNRLFPNQPPVLTFFVPSGEGKVITTSAEGPRIEVVGAALDDRGLSRIQFLQGGKVIADLDLLDSLPRKQDLRRTFDLAKGPNELKVIATDSLGATQEQAFLVTRTPLIYERAWFFPSAVASSAAIIGLGLAVQRTRRRRAVRNRFNPYIAGAPVLED
ncbi:MAG TPA: hypothetical protein VEQ84_06135, partial [Vicinamibacteria bacterium]|nr:hypothetical protein [Vicinamibacteria bacterium]